jgi:hypothetical protein
MDGGQMAKDFGADALKWWRKEEAARKRRVARESRSSGTSGGSSRRSGHQGGWTEAQHGYVDGKPVTFALGWGSKEGEVLLADGHVNTGRPGSFWDGGHNHYGKGQGPNANVKDRGMYSGPGA